MSLLFCSPTATNPVIKMQWLFFFVQIDIMRGFWYMLFQTYRVIIDGEIRSKILLKTSPIFFVHGFSSLSPFFFSYFMMDFSTGIFSSNLLFFFSILQNFFSITLYWTFLRLVLTIFCYALVYPLLISTPKGFLTTVVLNLFQTATPCEVLQTSRGPLKIDVCGRHIQQT